MERSKLSGSAILLPAETLEALRLPDGAEFEVENTPQGILFRPAQPLAPAQPYPPKTVDEVFGMLHRPGQRALTIEEMDEGIMRAVRERHERSRY